MQTYIKHKTDFARRRSFADTFKKIVIFTIEKIINNLFKIIMLLFKFFLGLLFFDAIVKALTNLIFCLNSRIEQSK